VRHETPIAENTIVRVCTTTGRVVAAFGAGEHYMPHGLSLGPDGSVWITDVGLHQVIRYNQTTVGLCELNN
jgi:streptogramin lyase